MKDFFKPEDFANLKTHHLVMESRHMIMTYEFSCKNAAIDANIKLNQLLDSWPIVFGNSEKTSFQWTERKHPIDTHFARLAFIEQLRKEPCKHEPKPMKTWHEHGEKQWGESSCRHCGVELRATWTEAKP